MEKGYILKLNGKYYTGINRATSGGWHPILTDELVKARVYPKKMQAVECAYFNASKEMREASVYKILLLEAGKSEFSTITEDK